MRARTNSDRLRLARRLGAACLLLGACSAAVAAAASFKQGTYHGSLAAPHRGIKVSLKLTGTKVTVLKLSDLPLACLSVGKPIPIHFADATVSSSGHFKSTGKYVIAVGPLKGKVGDRLTINGTFAAHGKLSGTVKNVNTTAPVCTGTTSFTASA